MGSTLAAGAAGCPTRRARTKHCADRQVVPSTDMDVGDDAAAGNGGLDERVQLLITADGQLQMARSDALHLQILGGVACQLQHLRA